MRNYCGRQAEGSLDASAAQIPVIVDEVDGEANVWLISH